MTIEAELKKRAAVWAGQITRNANQNLGKYKRLIAVRSQVTESAGKIAILSTASPTSVSEYGDVKNVARAYEYGSGIHSKRGGAKKYIIKPRRRKVLAFMWDVVNEETPAGKKFRGISKTTGKALFNYVEHPGVQAANGGQGYLKPAIVKIRAQIRQEVPAEIRKELIGNFRRAFKKA